MRKQVTQQMSCAAYTGRLPKKLEPSNFRPKFRKTMIPYAPLTHTSLKSPFLGDFKKV